MAVTLTYRETQSKNNRLYYQLFNDQYKIIFKLYTHIGRNAKVAHQAGSRYKLATILFVERKFVMKIPGSILEGLNSVHTVCLKEKHVQILQVK